MPATGRCNFCRCLSTLRQVSCHTRDIMRQSSTLRADAQAVCFDVQAPETMGSYTPKCASKQHLQGGEQLLGAADAQAVCFDVA